MTAPARASRVAPPPPPGTVEVRVRGHTGDLTELIERLREAGFTVWHSPAHAYPDSNGVTIRRYLTVDLRDPQP